MIAMDPPIVCMYVCTIIIIVKVEKYGLSFVVLSSLTEVCRRSTLASLV